MSILKQLFNRSIYKAHVYLNDAQMALNPEIKKSIVDNFHKLYYDSAITGGTWRNTFFLGTKIQKCPLDLFIYQEILFDVKPDLIIETGTAFGGGALWLASMCDLMDHGEVVTVDITKDESWPTHKRISYIVGSSVDESVLAQIRELVKGKQKVMVILDSDHSKAHVLNELFLYHSFVTPGSYLIVEDTNVNGHPVQIEHGPGPMEALEEFLKDNNDFERDESREKFYLSFNPHGYLKKK